ncbi:mitotic checkpoint regulator, MAD2B-interacting-domain-containing protein [Cladorrhinum samala]|uniref:Mitotic checkpoint regulator, MAD2B-interacting-domain-containing protein n=1 Tax=Cladorrhinum samala TaxID=585594 RepID=A0AAV9HLB0_9PEZI|nr:mitotic checkpoint regulator, MAD2B-interacting-domain-containing protein [Cladorrhinum samala]
MGLVDYSDSDSDSDQVPQKPTAPPTASSTAGAASKKPFQKLLDKGKIVVSLPAASATADTADDGQPPAKRAKTAGGGGSRFSSFGAFLPPPKKAAASSATNTAASSSRPAISGLGRGVSLRTGSEPAFVRTSGGDADGNDGTDENNTTSSTGSSNATSGLSLPPPRKTPSIPEGQKPEEEVKLVGKPLMFKPLSVTRKKATPITKKKEAKPAAAMSVTTSNGDKVNNTTNTTPSAAAAASQPAAPAPKKISLFSVEEDDTPSSSATEVLASSGSYEPIFSTAAPEQSYPLQESYTASYAPPQPQSQQSASHHPQSLSSIADSMSLSAAARRELFGRDKSSSSSSSFQIPADAKVITFDMEQEYAHNEQLRVSGEQQVYNPVRSIAPGKHSLRQVVNMAQNNLSALEDSFAQGRANKRDAAGRYGWK